MTIHDMKHHAAPPGRGLGRVHQAAALAWRNSDFGLQVLLVSSLTTGRWVLPKGWVEEGEDLAGTASRETQEEAGVSGEVMRDPIGRYSYAKKRKNGRIDDLTVEVYALQAMRSAENWPERLRRKRLWASPEAAATMVVEPELSQLIRAFGRQMQQR